MGIDRCGEINMAYNVPWTIALFGAWRKDGDGAGDPTNGGGIVGDVLLTQAGATFAKVLDSIRGEDANVDNSSGLTDYTLDDQLLSDAATETIGHHIYFGHSIPFCELAIDLATLATWSGDGCVGWEYWDGAGWAAITILFDNTDSSGQDGARTFQRDGAISLMPPVNWEATSIGGQTAFWIRNRIEFITLTQTPIMQPNEEHSIVTPRDGFLCPHGGTIKKIRLIDRAATLHTTDDVKFILMNFTTGAHTGELTFAQDQRQDAYTGLSLVVDPADELGVLVTQEDSGNDDPEDVILELTVTPG